MILPPGPARASVVALGALVELVRATDASAQQQALVRFEVAALNRYHWRGIRRSDAPVIQPGVSGGVRLADPLWLTAGGFGNFELGEGQRHHRWELGDGGGRADEEATLWAGVEINRPGWSVSTGVVRSWFARAGADLTATESFFRFERVSPVVAPRLEVWHDYHGGRGTYFELGLSRIIANPLPGPGVNLILTALTGYVAGVDSGRAPAGLPGFTRSGFTHSALQLAIRLTPRFGPIELALDLTPQVEFGWDPATKVRRSPAGDRGHLVRGWLQASLGVALPSRKRE